MYQKLLRQLRRYNARMPPAGAGRILLLGWFTLLLAPLFFASLARPFAWWDDLTIPATCMTTPESSLAAVPEVFWRNLLFHAYFLRPTTCAVNQAYYALFGGEFWVVYLAKWAAKVAAAWLLYRLLVRLETPAPARWAAVSFCLFHPAAPELMAFAPDGWLAPALLGFTCFVVHPRWSPGGAFAVEQMSRAAWWTAAGMMLLFSGIKEVAVVFFGLYAAMALLLAENRGRAAARLALPGAYLAFLAIRIAGIAPHRPMRAASVSEVLEHFLIHLRFVVPGSPWEVVGVLVAVSLGWLVYRLARRPDGRLAPLAVFCALFCAGALAMVSGTQPGARYVVPVVPFVAALCAWGAVAVPARARGALLALAAVFPLSTAGDLYAQHLAYQQALYEGADIVALLDQKHAAGAPIGVPASDRDLSSESRDTVRLFFEQLRRSYWGGAAGFHVVDLAKEPPPRTPFAIVARNPVSVDFPDRDAYEVTAVEAYRRGGYGVLERWSGLFHRMARALGNDRRPTYDLGAPMLSDEPELFVLTFSPRRELPSPSIRPLTLEVISHPSGATDRRQAGLEQETRIACRPGEGFVARVSLGALQQTRQLAWRGRANVLRGVVTFGVTDREGRDLWNLALPAGRGPEPLPLPPRLTFPRLDEYFLFFYAPVGDGAEIVIAGLALEEETPPLRLLKPARRYGAVAR